MLFFRSDNEVVTRPSLDGETLGRIEKVKLVGFWIKTFLTWEKNKNYVCKNPKNPKPELQC